jgi:hypothetical protein
MIVFLILLVIVVGAWSISNVIKDKIDRRKWVNSSYWRVPNIWLIGRAISDPLKEEFEVKFNPEDGHFYDREETGYHCTEIEIKCESIEKNINT